MPEIYPIPASSVANRTMVQALHEAHCITPGCEHAPSEADVHLVEVALAWVRLRAICDDVFEAVKGSLERTVDAAACDDPECTWETHNAAAMIATFCATL